jgi:excinuclease ABC subunit C
MTEYHALKNIEKLKELLQGFPSTPGVYLMKNELGKIIYVGKAKKLKDRVRSYLTDSKEHSVKTKVLVSKIKHIDFLLTKTEVEAFLLEASLIKKHQPKYNIRLKDDKSYPYIRFSFADEFPRLYLARRVKADGSLYFGPYTSGRSVFETIRFLNQNFKIRDCTDSVLKTRKRPCMTYQIGRCTAPCVQYITEDKYKFEMQAARDFLNGNNKKLVKDLNEKMKSAAENEQFEIAARARDSIKAINFILEKQALINETSELNQDAIGFFGDEQGCLIMTVHARKGRIIGQRAHFYPELNPRDKDEDPREWLVSFINQYYEENVIPDEVLLSLDLGGDLNNLVSAVLKERSKKDTIVRFATDENGRKLIQTAEEFAKLNHKKNLDSDLKIKHALINIQNKLSICEIPNRIECFDISTFQGDATVGSMVVAIDGKFEKSEYKKFKVKTVQGTDDFASMNEVLSRRFKHTEWPAPQLLLIDGGKGQLAIAVQVLKKLNIANIAVVGLAKARTKSDFTDQNIEVTQERFYLPGRQNPVIFKENSLEYKILVSLRDEAHRFAIEYHRNVRDKKSLQIKR